MIEITTPDNIIFERINKEYAKELNIRLVKTVNPIRKRVRDLLRELFELSNTVQQLRDGLLKHELGVASSDEAANAIIERICDSVEVEFKKITIGSSVGGGIEIRAVLSDFSDVLEIPEGSYINEADTIHKGELIPWLEWLLTRGTAVLVYGYYFNPVSHNKSRSGFGLMKEGNENWDIESQYAGTEQDNFITRAINEENSKDKITEIVQEEVKRVT